MRKIATTLLLALTLSLGACDQSMFIKDELSEEQIQKLTPQQERYILLADIKTWTGVARAYAERPFCSTTVVIGCAQPRALPILAELLGRLQPVTIALSSSALTEDELTQNLTIGLTLLLQLQAELAALLAQKEGA